MHRLARIAGTGVALSAVVAPLAAAAALARSAAATLPEPKRIAAASIDPADYLASVPDASALARRLVARLAASGVNTLYVNAYNVEYGAYYRTSYRFNTQSDYGRQDLLGKLLTAAHARGIRVVAAFYDHQHRGAWEARPGWRANTRSGGYYNPPVTDIQYYLSTGNRQAVSWWQGFLQDLLRRYPDLDGVELREPIINWWGAEADYNPDVTRAFRAAHPDAPLGGETWRRFREEMLTRFLKGEIALIHRYGRTVDVTTVATTGTDGHLVSPASLAHETAFDLDGVLDGPDRPDALKVELIWQQWARLYGRIVFTPEWTRTAAREALRQVHGRVPVVIHVELTDFGRSAISLDEFYRTLRAADLPQVRGVDFYSTFLADRKHAWPAVSGVYRSARPATSIRGVPRDRRVLVLYDVGAGRARNDVTLARLRNSALLNLLGHFDVKWNTRPVDSYRRGELLAYDTVIYEGSVYGNAPQQFLSDVSVFPGTVVWIGQNLFELPRNGVRIPFAQSSQAPLTGYRQIRYRGKALPARGEVIRTRAEEGARVVASLAGPHGSVPFVLRAGRFWYVAGSPFSFLDASAPLNGRYLVFADLLHDMLRESDRPTQRRAFLRIEDVNPLTDPASIRRVTDVLASRHVPFLLSVTPFYVDPARNLDVSLSERPQVAEALRYAVDHGGAIVLDGATHQYRGHTGADAEFWDVRNHGGLPVDGDEFVRDRIERALDEVWGEDLHPLAWETPDYRATPFDYALFADYFSTFVERRTYGVWRGSAYQQALPFETAADVFGATILPENLGLGTGGADDADALLGNARELEVVRDAVAGGFVDVGADPKAIGRIADSLRRMGYKFIDLYRLSNVVNGPDRVEVTGVGTASLPVPTGSVLYERVLARNGSVLRAALSSFPSYVRPTRSYRPVPDAGLASIRVVSAREAASGLDGIPRPSTPFGTRFVSLLVYVGTAVLGLLLIGYVRIKTTTRRLARR